MPFDQLALLDSVVKKPRGGIKPKGKEAINREKFG
jgi:hypothetical protein